jgi:glycosyltransferase involved in cell wall biosynthesis
MRSQHRWADAVITVTPGLVSYIKRQTKQTSIYLVPNGADPTTFKPDSNEEIKIIGSFVLFYGAFARWQGIESMIKAISLPQWPKAVKMVFAGDGVMKNAVELASQNDSAIIYIGRIPYNSMPALISKSLGVLIPKNNITNLKETGATPLKLFESLACGVPVIVSDIPGQADFIRKYKCGLIIPPDDPVAIADAVRFLYDNEKIRVSMGQLGRDIIIKEHSWDKRAERTDNILNQLYERKHRHELDRWE